MRAERFSQEELREFCIAALCAKGVSRDDAATVSDSLIDAELHGVSSHGMPHLLLYIDKLDRGEALPQARPTVERLGPNLFRINGQRSLGQIAGAKAMGMCLAAAKEYGLAAAWVHNTHTYGAAGYFARMAVQANCVGLTFTNTTPLMAPWQGRLPLLGTNPIAVGIPCDGGPLVLDMACSVSAWGNIVNAARRNERIPDAWALDSQGRPTSDPQEALAGALLPAGGYKGYGLALVFEILTGLLAGAGLSEPIPRAPGNFRSPLRSHVMMVIDVQRFQPIAAFKADVLRYLEQLRACPPADGCDQVRVPGDRSRREFAERSRHGIPLDADLVDRLRALARQLGLRFPAALPEPGNAG
ncbi:Ldh family oxidoreductase [Geochorda subterranea]|uniref:Ldh family oxidoreductase n=1 Tax=Geochorda subterranea TaxID=3109564 RepID=A0ABZ1BRV2_9FIRM|nr:Ldh family oxidoreductase [Limnochorda sp. LNt]WRP15245.1 Ldh family oxidoreductase [Limnochorda sp. LNt]